MQVEVKIPGDVKKDTREKHSVSVETHVLRNDTFIIQRSDTMLEGDQRIFNVPAGGRLIVNAPKENEVVFDKEQGAAVRVAQQNNDEQRADRAGEVKTPAPDPKAAEQAARAEAAAKAKQEAEARAEETKKRQEEENRQRAAAAQKAKEEAEAKAKQEAEAKAKAQTGAQTDGASSPQTGAGTIDTKNAS